ncbi:MAG: hypothetical protein ACSHYC_18330 [Alphaproteobacteria bacterium]
MTQEISKDAAALAEFVKKWSGARLKSTGAEVVDYSGALYNVNGSSDDPTINGLNWRGLLIRHGIDSNCYVDNVPAPAGLSHPDFSVGGHMTSNSDGSVKIGGVCYLMPLCSWHNHKTRDGNLFEHSKTAMIKLSGYMEAEPAATFMARGLSDEDYSMISLPQETGSPPLNLSLRRSDEKGILMQSLSSESDRPFFVLLKKEHGKNGVFYSIDEALLPDSH